MCNMAEWLNVSSSLIRSQGGSYSCIFLTMPETHIFEYSLESDKFSSIQAVALYAMH